MKTVGKKPDLSNKNELLLSYLKKEIELAEAAVEEANEIQWQRAKRNLGTEAGIRQRGGMSDPTGDTACDGDRLAVRSAWNNAERMLMVAYKAVRQSRTELEIANRRWHRD